MLPIVKFAASLIVAAAAGWGTVLWMVYQALLAMAGQH